jgi:hypothetical protein
MVRQTFTDGDSKMQCQFWKNFTQCGKIVTTKQNMDGRFHNYSFSAKLKTVKTKIKDYLIDDKI